MAWQEELYEFTNSLANMKEVTLSSALFVFVYTCVARFDTY